MRGIRPRRDTSELKLSADRARQQPGTADDPAKVIENLPGLARSSFGSDQLVLWGAAPEDTRVFIDGVEIPQLFHGSGLRSAVNGELLQSISLSPGAFGADYGRAIGGLVRLETRDLPPDRVHATIDASTLDASLRLSAPVTERVRLAVGARYGLLDRTLHALGARDVSEFFAVPRYRDYSAQAQIDLGPRERLDAVLLGSSDEVSRFVADPDPARTRRVGNSSAFQRLYVRYRRAFADGSNVEVVAWVGRDESQSDARFGANPARSSERALRWGVRAEQQARLSDAVALRLGIDVASRHARLERQGSLTIPAREGDIAVFGQPPGDDTNADDWRATVLDVAPYIDLDGQAGPLLVTPGLRIDGYLLEASRSTPRIGRTPSIEQSSLTAEIEPRLSARLRLSSSVELQAAAGSYSQPPAVADLSAVFGTPSLEPERAEHVSLGEAVELTPTLSVSVTSFYRALSRLDVRDRAPTPRLANALVSVGRGRSLGAQLFLQQKPWHGFSGSVAYTISRSERRDEPGASLRLFDYDEPHVLNVVGSQALGGWNVGLRFRYASGAPRTAVTGALFDEKDDAFQPNFGPQNQLRLPNFWQLDARLDREFALARQAQLRLFLELLNVTDRRNGEEYRYDASYARRSVITGLPFVAVLGGRLEL